jgi:hypothetical protein
MPESNIGPCECCGSVCTCTLVTCRRRWTGGIAGMWSIIRSCGSNTGVTDELDKPCCGCPAPGFPGTDGQETDVFCTQGTGSNACDCSRCTATWSTVLDDWILSSCAVSGGSSNRCTCPTQVKPTPRPSNGYVISNITCSC